MRAYKHQLDEIMIKGVEPSIRKYLEILRMCQNDNLFSPHIAVTILHYGLDIDDSYSRVGTSHSLCDNVITFELYFYINFFK